MIKIAAGIFAVLILVLVTILIVFDFFRPGDGSQAKENHPEFYSLLSKCYEDDSIDFNDFVAATVRMEAVYRYKLPKGAVLVEMKSKAEYHFNDGKLKKDDIITHVNGIELFDVEDLKMFCDEYESGTISVLTVFRNGLYYELEYVLK